MNIFQELSCLPVQKYSSLMTGDKEVLASLREKTGKYKIPVSLWHDHALRWPRDCRVVLSDQKCLIPSSLTQLEDSMFYALLPSPMLHFVTEKQRYTAHGITEWYQERAITLARRYKMKWTQGVSCIEGGNCHLFKGADGRAKAIVGYSSLILTVISLFEKNVFEKSQPKLNRYIADHPELSSPDSLRVARNFLHALNKMECDPTAALKQEEEALWMESAKKIEALFAFAKEAIAEELEIPLERIAFVFQERLHIDMELFVGPDDHVFLHDEALMQELQQKISVFFPFSKNTSQYSASHLAINQKILEENTKILERIGCKAARVPGVLTAEFEEGSIFSPHLMNEWLGEETPFSKEDERPRFVYLLNFMNGLFFSDPEPRWISAGPPKGHLMTNFVKKAFKQAIQVHCPELRFSLLRTVHLSKRLTIGLGGLRCLTSPI